MKVNKAVILAAGKGTRFLPYTKAYPKEMLAVVDKPALQLIVEEVVQSGITDIMIIISPDKEAVTKHFERDDEMVARLISQGKADLAETVDKLGKLACVSYAYQPTVTGTGMAVKLAQEWAAGEPFAVLNGDDVMYNQANPVTAQLVEAFEKTGKTVVGVQTVTREAIVKYASCKTVSSQGRLHLISDIIEKPTKDEDIHSLLAPLGRYVLSGDIFDIIDKTPVRSAGEVYLTDSLQIQAKNGGIYVYDFEGKRYDFGDKLGYLEGVTEYALRDEALGEKYKQYLLALAATLK